jgi:putative MATE family efflux protein
MSEMQNKAENPLFRLTIWMIAIPIFVDFLLTFSVFFTDSFFLSRISDTAAASVGSMIPVFMVAVLLFMMIAQGGSNVAGQFLGAQQTDKVEDTYTGTLFINTMAGLATGLLFFFGSSAISKAMGLSGDAFTFADTYLHYISLALVVMAMKYALASVFISQGKTVWNMYAGILVNVLNIGLNILFLYGLEMGIFGVILATTISQIVVLLFFWFVIKRQFQVPYNWSRLFRNFSQTVKPVLAIGLPSAVQPISTELGMLVISAMAVQLGEEAMAARTYVMNLLTLAICWAASIAIGNQVLVAHRVGAQLHEDAKKVLASNLVIAMAGSGGIAIVLYLLSNVLIGIFTDNETILEAGAKLLLVGLLLEPLRSLSTMTGYALKATGDAVFPAAWSIVATWAVAIPFAYYFGLKLEYGIVGLWLGLVIDEGVRGGINYYRWLSNKWMKMGILVGSEVELDGGKQGTH